MLNQPIQEDIALLIPLVSFIESVSLSGPVTVLPNQVFDVYVTVHPPHRPDLKVPSSDYTVEYEANTTVLARAARALAWWRFASGSACERM